MILKIAGLIAGLVCGAGFYRTGVILLGSVFGILGDAAMAPAFLIVAPLSMFGGGCITGVFLKKINRR